MKSLTCIIFAIVILSIHDSLQLEDLLNTNLHHCIECLCHARTGCYRRRNCASYSINYDYWTRAGSPTLRVTDPVNQQSYMACMLDENCILNTIKLYTDGYGNADCNCDSFVDCRDMLMLHLHGDRCRTNITQTYTDRYNSCASRYRMQPLDTMNNCIPSPQ